LNISYPVSLLNISSITKSTSSVEDLTNKLFEIEFVFII
jgi:hypothetical protein